MKEKTIKEQIEGLKKKMLEECDKLDGWRILMKNEHKNNKIGQSETIANYPAKTRELSQADQQSNSQSPSKPPIFKYRPNNSFLKVKILSEPKDFHLPVVKTTGKNTRREYLYWPDATFERTVNSNIIIMYPKMRFVKLLSSSDEVDKANQEYIDRALSLLAHFQELYPDVKLDSMNARVRIKEFEIKHKNLVLPRNLRFKDTVGKKVYSTGIELYDPVHIKNTINSLATIDHMQRIEDMLFKFSQNLELHLEVLQGVRDAVKELKRESFLERVVKWLRHRFWEK